MFLSLRPYNMAQMGSHFADMTIHDLDEARWMLGCRGGGGGGPGVVAKAAREPSRVFATMDEGRMRAAVTLRCADGCMVHIVNDRRCAAGYDQRVEVLGAGGVARHDALPKDPAEFFTERYAGAYEAALRCFLEEVVVGGGEPRVGPLDALHAANLARACDDSLRLGREVEVPALPGLLAN